MFPLSQEILHGRGRCRDFLIKDGRGEDEPGLERACGGGHGADRAGMGCQVSGTPAQKT